MNQKEFCHYCKRLFALKLISLEQFHRAIEGSKEITFNEEKSLKIDTSLGFPRIIEDTDED